MSNERTDAAKRGFLRKLPFGTICVPNQAQIRRESAAIQAIGRITGEKATDSPAVSPAFCVLRPIYAGLHAIARASVAADRIAVGREVEVAR